MHPVMLRAVAAGGTHPLIDIDGTVFIQLGVFLVMAFLATNLLFKPYLKMREERSEAIDGARAEASLLDAEADTLKADGERRMAEARDRALDEQRKVRAEAAAHQREVTETARLKANEALEIAHAKVAEETAKARAELLPRADALAQEIVQNLLSREVA